MKLIKLNLTILFVIVFVFNAKPQDTSYKLTFKKFENLAPTPPMGWNSWNKFGCNIDEELIKDIAKAMVMSGMKDAGYQYINLDDCWHGQRDSLGFIHPDPEKFPSGMKALADYIHSMGLKIGIYSDAGNLTCGGRPGSRGYEFQDAMTYASWGIDYLKYDWCNTDGLNAEGAYKTISGAIKKAGRPMILSICEWGQNLPWRWGHEVAQLWRTTTDIHDCFDCIIDHGFWEAWGVLQILDAQDSLRRYSGPNNWNDPDMLEVGNQGLSYNESKSHFTMWAMLSAPLIAGNDIRNMNEETKSILLNQNIISVDQDPLGIAAFKYKSTNDIDIWVKPLSNNEWAICFLNRSKNIKELTFDWSSEKIKDNLINKELDFSKTKFKIFNLWTSKNQGFTNKPLNLKIESHDIIALKLIP